MRFLLFLFLASCSQTPVVADDAGVPAVNTCPKISWETAKNPERRAWSVKTCALIDELMPKLDKASDLKRFGSGDKKKLWAEIISAMVYFESGYNPKSYYMEPPPLNYHSIGLLQLSYSDAKYYKFCKLDEKKKNLEDPIVNLDCGVRILAQLIEKRGAITTPDNKGGAAYWSVLREKRKLPDVIARVKKNL